MSTSVIDINEVFTVNENGELSENALKVLSKNPVLFMIPQGRKVLEAINNEQLEKLLEDPTTVVVLNNSGTFSFKSPENWKYARNAIKKNPLGTIGNFNNLGDEAKKELFSNSACKEYMEENWNSSVFNVIKKYNDEFDKSPEFKKLILKKGVFED